MPTIARKNHAPEMVGTMNNPVYRPTRHNYHIRYMTCKAMCPPYKASYQNNLDRDFAVGWAVPTKKTSQLKNNHKKLTAHLLNALNKGGGGHSPPYCFPP